jgi:hypothetical protein
MIDEARLAARRAPAVCRKLRTKKVNGTGAPGEMWAAGEATTAAFYCLSTMEVFGPDEAPCHPHQCTRERGCFRPPDYDDEALS